MRMRPNVRASTTPIFAALLFLGLPVVSAAPVPKELRTSDLDRIAGAWVPTPDDGSIWRFGADGSATIIRPGAAPFGVKYALDPTGHPKTIRWMSTGGNRVGIYEFEGDTLTLCLTPANGEHTIAIGKLAVAPGVELFRFSPAATDK